MVEDEKSAHDFNPKTESHSNLSNTLQPTTSKAQTCTQSYVQKYVNRRNPSHTSHQRQREKEQNEG